VNEAEPSDAALVGHVLGGDPDAFRALVERYYAACGRYAYRMLGHWQDAEDALQETFVRVYRGLGGYDERNTFRAWLYRILVNECGTLARRRVRRARRIFEDRGAIERRAVPSPEHDADIRDALQHALSSVEPPLREAFLLHYAEGFGYDDMATLTGASVSALKMRVKRARDALRPTLEGDFHG
jgi:RNA polymerase sigma-70 factor (ECF subfamily)